VLLISGNLQRKLNQSKRKNMNATTTTKLEEQFMTADGCIVAEESGNDYMVDNIMNGEMSTYEPLQYDYKTKTINPKFSDLPDAAAMQVKVDWKIKKFFAESMTGVSAHVTGVDSRGRDWDGMAQFKITERVACYDDIDDEDYYLVHMNFAKVEQAACAQDSKDRRIDSAQGLVKN
jgi:hypothetical protein